MYIYLVKNKHITFLLMVSMWLVGCAASPKMTLPATLPEPTRHQAVTSDQPVEQDKDLKLIRSQRLPALAVSQWAQENDSRWGDFSLPQEKLSLNVENMPLNEFIHVALGDVLGLSFTVDNEILKRQDPITLRVSKDVNAKRILGMIEQILLAYKVGLAWNANQLQVLPESKLMKMPPSPVLNVNNVTGAQGRVMTIIPLSYAKPSEAINFVRHFVKIGQSGDVQVLSRLNALLVTGKASSIKRLKTAISMIDKPVMTGKSLQVIRPIYWQASEIAPLLKDALILQGITVAKLAGNPGVYISPIKQLNAMLVAAPNKETIAWVLEWVQQLDTPEAAGESLQSFVYFAQHSTAEELGIILSAVMGNVTNIGSDTPEVGNLNSEKKSSAATDGKNTESNLKIVVDKQHNSLVFVGSARDYRVAFQLLQQLDLPVKQVLVEVTIADVTLDKSHQLGVEWQDKKYSSDGSLDRIVSTLGGLGVGSAGLTITTLDSAGSVKARLNALAANGDARILSSPKLLALDNEEARIQVGTQIAVITSEIANTASVADSGVLRSFEYIDTGVILRFTPTVLANGMVRLVIYQEVSAPGASSNNTPPISKRMIETTLAAQTGQTVMLGGLITHNSSQQNTQVPWFGDIPLLGGLFRNRSTTNNSTEMIILITPHVIETTFQASELTDAFSAQLDW